MDFNFFRSMMEWGETSHHLNETPTGADCLILPALNVDLQVNIPLAVLGISIDSLVIHVWNGETTFQPTTYLFKAMAVGDILSRLMFSFSMIGLEKDAELHWLIYDHWFLQHSELAGMYCIIMLLALVRYMTISYNVDNRCQPLSRGRMRLAIGLIYSGYLTLASLLNLSRHALPKGPTLEVMTGLYAAAVYVTIFAQIFMMMLLLYKIRFPLAGTLAIGPEPLSSRLRTSCRRPARPTARQTAAFNRIASRKLEYTVLVICLNSLVMGPGLGFFLFSVHVHVVDSEQMNECLARVWFYALFQLACSWNIIFYVMFLNKFRHLFFKRCPRCVTYFFDSSDFSETVLPSSYVDHTVSAPS
jgi:hypothetical protein